MNESSHPFGDREPPGALEERVERTLTAAGLLEQRSHRYRHYALRAAILLFVAGAAFLTGRWQRSAASTDTMPHFLMLLYEDSTYRDDRPVREVVAEYAGWADSLRQDRALVLGEKLGNTRAELPTRTDQLAPSPTGMFILRANDLPHATALASTSPHLRYGGRVVIHPIDR